MQILLSFPNANPTSHEHSWFSFLLLQIWLQPPLFASSHGCTKVWKWWLKHAFDTFKSLVIYNHTWDNLTFVTCLSIFSQYKSIFTSACEFAFVLFTNLAAAAITSCITRMYWKKNVIDMKWTFNEYVYIAPFKKFYKADIIYNFFSPFLQVFLSFPNINPTLQEHTSHSFLLLQIWLHPPLFFISQGCTKTKNNISEYIIPFFSGLPIYASNAQRLKANLCYKFAYHLPTQIHLHNYIRTSSLSCYKFDYSHLYLQYHKDVLKIEDII